MLEKSKTEADVNERKPKHSYFSDNKITLRCHTGLVSKEETCGFQSVASEDQECAVMGCFPSLSLTQ